MEIHLSNRMQPSAEIARSTTNDAAQEEGGSTCPSNDSMITLRYVDSPEGALPRPHWELIDRTRPKYDALRGLRGRRPQMGPLPRVLTAIADANADRLTGAVEDVDGTNVLADRRAFSNSSIPTAVAGDVQSGMTEPVCTSRNMPVPGMSKEVSLPGGEVAIINRGVQASTSINYRPSDVATLASPSRATAGSDSYQSAIEEVVASRNRRSQRIQSTEASFSSKEVKRHTSSIIADVDSTTDSASETLENPDNVADPEDVSIGDTDSEEPSSKSEAVSEAANSSASSATHPHPSKSPGIDATAFFGRRAERLAKAAARQATLARLTTDVSVNVSVEAHRIAQQREDPNFNRAKAVATAISNRFRGLRPRTLPCASASEDDEDDEDDENDEDDEEHDDQEDDGDDYDEDGQGGDDNDLYTGQNFRAPRPNLNLRRRRQDDDSADYVPGKKRKSITLTASGFRRKSVSTSGAGATTTYSARSTSASTPTLSAFNVSQAKNRRGRRSDSNVKRPFSCEVCGERFVRQEHMKRHVKSLHSGEKPYQCSRCGKQFARNDNLTQHMKTHTAEESTVAWDGTMGQTGVHGAQQGRGYQPTGGLGFGQVEGNRMPEGAVDEEARAQLQQIVENHQRLENQGKL